MGEESWRVHRTGAPSLDHLLRSELPTADEVAQELGLAPDASTVLFAYHPVTLARDTLCESGALFAALERVEGTIVFCFPNADAGSRQLIRRATEFCDANDRAPLFGNLRPVLYLALLRQVGALLGNSSSGIMETPSLALPCVNVGLRQRGRERAANIIDVEPEADAILGALRRALDPAFRRSLHGMVNPYGDGTAAQRIVRVLAETPLGEELLIKRAVPLPRQVMEYDPHKG